MENLSTPVNPLSNYFRTFKNYIKLPSGTSYYENNEVDFNTKGEVGILPMTGQDELILKNPEALLNGEALIHVIASCVPAVKNPRNLLTNDIDALITAIRHATFNDKLEIVLKCPECTHENTFSMNLDYTLNNMSFLEKEYIVNLESGLSIFIKPYGFEEMLKSLTAQFEHTKIKRSIENESLPDNERLKIFSEAFKSLSNLTFDLVCNSIIKIVNEEHNINVVDKDYIKTFLKNIDKISLDKITDLVKHINTIGIKKTFTAKCDKCDHTWENDLDLNPTQFF